MTDRHQTYLYRKHVVNDELIKQAGLKGKSHSLPKTFLTKKGPLLLFSEDSIIETDFFPIHNERTVQIESSIKTTKNLRKSILEFGLHMGSFKKSKTVELERQNTLESFSFFKNPRFEAENYAAVEDFQFDKIRPGYSAKRYLSSLTKHWQPGALTNMATQGSLKEEIVYETAECQPSVRQRIDDDLSRVPPAYRIERKWLTVNVTPLKGYRFFRVKSGLFTSRMFWFPDHFSLFNYLRKNGNNNSDNLKLINRLSA